MTDDVRPARPLPIPVLELRSRDWAAGSRPPAVRLARLRRRAAEFPALVTLRFGPWVVFATDRRGLGRDVRLVAGAADRPPPAAGPFGPDRFPRPVLTSRPHRAMRFASAAAARRWLDSTVRSGRYCLTAGRLAPVPPPPVPSWNPNR